MKEPLYKIEAFFGLNFSKKTCVKLSTDEGMPSYSKVYLSF
jgi:hypothetical protein